MKAPLTAQEQSVWAAWNALDDECPNPAKTIARQLGMSIEDVAFIVFPAEHFGRWTDDREPDLQ